MELALFETQDEPESAEAQDVELGPVVGRVSETAEEPAPVAIQDEGLASLKGAVP